MSFKAVTLNFCSNIELFILQNFVVLIFLVLTFFAGKILLLVLWDMLCRFLNDLVTQISKLKKLMNMFIHSNDITF